MAEIINMPRLSDTMEEGVVAKWLKKVGDTVKEGDILAEIETDKATMEFESFHAGVLLHIGLEEGKTAPVDSLLAIIGEKGEDISSLLKKDTAPVKTEAAKPAETKPETKPLAKESVTIPDNVKVVTILAEIETDKATMEFESFNAGTLLYVGIKKGETAPVDSLLAIIGPAGTDVSGIVKNFGVATPAAVSEAKETPKTEEKSTPAQPAQQASTSTAGGRVLASPLAKKIAAEKGIDLQTVKGSGDNGRITKADVESYKPQAAATSSSAPQSASAQVTAFVPAGEEHFEDVTNSQMRKTIARRLGESKFTAPHYYLTIEVSMDQAIQSRLAINALPDTKVSFNDLVIKAVAMALKKHPQVNTQWKDTVMRYNQHIHVGVAVAVEDGLVVPVLKFTDQLSLTQIGNSVKDLAGRARNKKLQPAEMEGSTFTVSNLGMFGIEEFTSIINQPNSAILSVGAIIEKPVVKNGQIVVGNQMKLTLACDHRTVDGATGSQFLQTLKSFLENPVTMLA